MPVKKLLLLLLTTSLGPAASSAAPVGPKPYLDRLYVVAQPRDAGEVEAIWALAEDVLEPHDPALAEHTLVITPSTLQRLRERQIPLRVDPRHVQSWLDGMDRQDRITRLDSGAGRDRRLAVAEGKLGIFGPFFERVQPLAAIEAYLEELAAASQGRAKLVELGRSVEGRPIWALRISGATDRSARPSVVVVGAQHAREWASPVVTMGLADALVRRYGIDPRVTRVVDNLEIIINPVNNPDGYLATFNGRRLQRKNLNPDCNVDLNRNYETAWGDGTAGAGCNAGNYPGQRAFSEPESQAIKRLIESLARPVLFFDYHSTGAQVMIPFAYTTTLPPGYEKNRALCELYAATLRQLNGTSYPARAGYNLGRGQGGGAFDWFRTRYADTMVVELGGGPAFAINDAQVVPFAEENWVAWLAVAERMIDASAVTPDAGTSPAPAVDAGSDGASPDAGGGGLSGLPGPTGTPSSPSGNGFAPGAPVTPVPDDVEVGCGCALGSAPRSRGWVPFAVAVALGCWLAARRRSASAAQKQQRQEDQRPG
jgi:carboxypeptidase T